MEDDRFTCQASYAAHQHLKTQVSQNDITLKELKYQTDIRLQQMGPRALSKEVPYLWEPLKEKKGRGGLIKDYQKSADNLNAAAHYYFVNTRSQRMWLLAGGPPVFYLGLLQFSQC